MFAHVRILACEIAFLILFMFLCGCISTSIGEVGYANDAITARINNPNGPSDAFVQVTIYQCNWSFATGIFGCYDISETEHR